MLQKRHIDGGSPVTLCLRILLIAQYDYTEKRVKLRLLWPPKLDGNTELVFTPFVNGENRAWTNTAPKSHSGCFQFRTNSMRFSMFKRFSRVDEPTKVY